MQNKSSLAFTRPLFITLQQMVKHTHTFILQAPEEQPHLLSQLSSIFLFPLDSSIASIRAHPHTLAVETSKWLLFGGYPGTTGAFPASKSAKNTSLSLTSCFVGIVAFPLKFNVAQFLFQLSSYSFILRGDRKPWKCTSSTLFSSDLNCLLRAVAMR